MNLFSVKTDTVLLYVWVLARVSGLVVSMPVLSGKAVPVRIKGLIAVALAFLIEPVVLDHFVPPRLFSAWLGSLVTEFFVGVALGFSAYLVFAAVSFAGELAGVQVGFGLVDVINPLGLAEVPLLGTFQNSVAFLVFLASGTHEALIWALGRSYAVVAPGEGRFRSVFYEGYLGVFAHFMVLGFTLAAPFLVGGIVLNLAMGFLSRMMPQMNLISVGFPVLVLGGLGLLILSLPFLGSVLEESFFRMEDTLGGILRLVGPHGG
ncbi:MAG: flagellar biosynthetic protein FliR [Nitrospirae bacterium]|nr:flagellar biosynthetic protein FliR [Nitrospirota bacterium]